ncbi:MAG: hypothetical protein K2H91_04740, partial [Lachnospiraceae bacterium]|nr:hypothetical protein [Lachnospiraceae bacterium]
IFKSKILSNKKCIYGHEQKSNTIYITRKIENHYAHHKVNISLTLVSNVESSERFIFRFKIMPGTKVESIFSCATDIKTAMQIPLFQPFRDGEGIYLAVSERRVKENSLYKMLTSKTFCKSKDVLPLALGYDLMGRMVFDDLAEMPHIMYAGTPRSGKSSGLICLILSLITKQPVKKVNLIIIDTGTSEMGLFNGIPHLSHPVVEDVPTGIYVIGKVVEEMGRRKKLDHSQLRMQPAIICIIDEFTSFIDDAGDKKQRDRVANTISDILRRGRHVKIHMVLADQNPTRENIKVDVSNVSSRIAFRCAKFQNSSTIFSVGGAEKLTGKGAALYLSRKYSEPRYLQGAYMPIGEVEKLLTCVKSIDYDLGNKFIIPELDTEELLNQETVTSDCMLTEDNSKKELAEIIVWTLSLDKVSAKLIMERYPMGNRVYKIVDQMYEMGIISGKNAKQPRKVLPQAVEDLSPETVHFLEQHGYDTESVKNAFKVREEHA